MIRDIPLKPLRIGNTSRGLTRTQLTQRKNLAHAVTGRGAIDPFVIAARRDTMRVVNAVVNTLPPRFASIVRLRYIKGWSQKKVSEALSLSVGSIRKLEKRALFKLGVVPRRARVLRNECVMS